MRARTEGCAIDGWYWGHSKISRPWGVEDAYRQLRQGFQPCVVLLDLHMPGMNGWAFLERMRIEPHLDDVAVVIVSGDADQAEAAKEAACDFLLKPVRNRDLVAAIGRHCLRHRATG